MERCVGEHHRIRRRPWNGRGGSVAADTLENSVMKLIMAACEASMRRRAAIVISLLFTDIRQKIATYETSVISSVISLLYETLGGQRSMEITTGVAQRSILVLTSGMLPMIIG